jgi:hypothetical protein
MLSWCGLWLHSHTKDQQKTKDYSLDEVDFYRSLEFYKNQDAGFISVNLYCIISFFMRLSVYNV